MLLGFGALSLLMINSLYAILYRKTSGLYLAAEVGCADYDLSQFLIIDMIVMLFTLAPPRALTKKN